MTIREVAKFKNGGNEMKERFKRVSALLLTVAMAVSCFAACGSNNETEQGGSDPVSTEGTEVVSADFSYPVDTDVTLTYWTELNANVAANYNNLSETTFGQNLQEETGISIEFQHPAVGQVSEQFNLLLGKTTLPDIIEYNWLGYSGGPEKAIKDGVIIPLNDIIDQYCPNLKAYLAANPEIDKMVKTDDGTYYCFPFIRGGDLLLTSTGLMIRQDWLTDLGLEVPTTIDEWETTLRAFKEQKGATAPFTYQYASGSLTNNNPFAYAYGVTRTFYRNDEGEIVYGAVEDGYKEYLQLMNKWMKEGLIDLDLITLTGDQVAAKITNGSAGASFGWAGSNLGTWTTSGQATDPNYVLVPAPYPTLEEGATPEMGQRDNNFIGTGSAAISTSCENVELAARLLDYAYSEAGTLLYNFGEEGTSYTVADDGSALFTDLVLKNPDLSVTHALAGYIRANYNGPFVQSEDYAKQYYALQTQKDALGIWSDTNMANHIVPPITPTTDESKEMSTIMSEIEKYRDQQTIGFINGTISFDEWDEYVATIEGMGLDRVLEIQNSALDRYNAR